MISDIMESIYFVVYKKHYHLKTQVLSLPECYKLAVKALSEKYKVAREYKDITIFMTWEQEGTPVYTIDFCKYYNDIQRLTNIIDSYKIRVVESITPKGTELVGMFQNEHKARKYIMKNPIKQEYILSEHNIF